MITMVMSRLAPEELAVVQCQLGRLASIEDVIRISELDQHNTTQEILRVIKPHVGICQNCEYASVNKENVFCMVDSRGKYTSKTDTCSYFNFKESPR